MIFGILNLAFGQTSNASVKPTYLFGDVTEVSAKSLSIKTKTGQSELVLTEKTAFKRASADFNIATATPGELADISVGDQVTVSSLLGADGKSMIARTVYIVTKSVLLQKQAKDSELWKTRGISGKVASVNPTTSQITVDVPGLMNKTAITVTLKQDAKILRYSGDSVKFSDAKSSTLPEIKIGDQISALGDKGEDGTTLLAEAVVTGTFLQMPGTVKSVDTAKNEVIIRDTKGKDITVALGGAILMKRFPPEMAERMAMARAGGGVRPATGGPAQAPQGQQGPGRGTTRGGSRGGIEEMLERLPNITVAEIKPGEQIGLLILVSGPAPAIGDSIKAIKLIAGIEPFMRMQASSPSPNRGQGVQGGFTIPGLEGGGF